MEKKIGKNVSSGAKKVESLEREEFSAETVDAVKPAQKKTVKKTVKRSAPKTAKTGKTAEKKESAAAQKRLDAARARAEKKEKKLAAKATLKEKKAERKAMIAKKKAERKQKRLEKQASLKEKRLERRAEKIARREMLKNESKAEKQKRIAREKKDRIALKRQRQEARDKAREQKLKAREAAHERKSQDKKHKREQNMRKRHAPGFGGWLAAVISLGVVCLALATVVTAGAFRMNDMTLTAENGSRATLYEMVSVSEDLDNNLSKLRVSSGVAEQRKLLTEIVVDSALLESALERIPVDDATSTDISAFVNKTASYARQLLAKIAAGETLSETEKNTINYLSDINSKLYNELNELATHMTQKDFRAFLGGKEGSVSQSFGEMGQGTKAEPEDIVDAPFSGEGNVGENKLAQLEEITSSRAEELVKKYFEAYHVRDVRYTGETAARDMTLYNFVLTDEGGVEIFAQITKNGGKLAFFDTYEICTQKNFDLDTCDTLAREFLSGLGMDNLEAVWLSDAGMVADLTYVSMDGGVLAYPDMVRVRVCESKGRVVGIDAKGYILNYEERDLGAGISEEEARAKLTSGLEAQKGTLALIPVDGREVLAYEFYCKSGDSEYLIYLDANTGDEVQMFRVRQSARGSYLR